MTPTRLRAALGGRRIGVHLALGQGMVRAADCAAAIGASAIQVFTDNPTAWRRRTAPPTDLPRFRLRLRELDIRLAAVHAAYLINLAGPEPDFWARSVSVLAAELRMAEAYGAPLVNVHIGSHKGAGPEAGRRQLGRGLAEALAAAELSADTGPRLVLENSAGGGDALGDSVEDLAAILEAAAAAGVAQARLAFCLDTAHLWGAGVDLRQEQVLDDLLARFDALLGAERLVLIHLNDSKAALGSRADRHQHIGAGAIGEGGLRGVILHPRLADVPMILETPGMDEGFDAVDMERVRRLIAGRRLPTLPRRALELHGGRARRSAPGAASDEGERAATAGAGRG